MKIPNFVDEKIVGEGGKLTDSWKQLLTVLFSQLQQNLSNEGHVVPSQNTTDMTTILSDAAKENGTLLYDETTHELKVKIGGLIKTIQVA
jgi:hypothetical protein